MRKKPSVDTYAWHYASFFPFRSSYTSSKSSGNSPETLHDRKKEEMRQQLTRA